MQKPTDDWASKSKQFIWNIFVIALFVIAIVKVLLQELHGLFK
jgi:hypothetical protein